MPFSSLAACPREDHPARPADPLAPPFYPIGLLPTMQGLLAAVADLETRYEIEREQIEHWSGSEEMKQQLLADLEDRHQARREICQERWDKLNSGSHSAPRSGSTERHDQFQPDDGNLKLPV